MRKAFALIDLLVVIGIVALLAMGVPPLRYAHDPTIAVVCQHT